MLEAEPYLAQRICCIVSILSPPRTRHLIRRLPSVDSLLEGAARVGYGARGFVYLSVGLIALMAAMDWMSDAVGTSGAVGWLAQQPFGRLWLILLGIGLWAFVLWRVLQSVFDADREGMSWKAWGMRAGQAMSGLVYGLLAAGVFELLDEVNANPAAEDIAENQQKAAALLDMPFGDWLLIGVGLIVAGVAIGNMVRGFRSDFSSALACSAEVCRRVVPVARAGYVARGFALLPLAIFVIIAGFQASAAEVSSFGAGLDALERQPGGSIILSLTGLGLMAFGAFAFVEARYRRIRAPKDLNPLN